MCAEDLGLSTSRLSFAIVVGGDSGWADQPPQQLPSSLYSLTPLTRTLALSILITVIPEKVLFGSCFEAFFYTGSSPCLIISVEPEHSTLDKHAIKRP